MVLAAEFSAELGMVGAADAARVTRHLADSGLPTRLQDIAGFRQEGIGDADALLALMFQDKKVKRGRLTFILLKALGQAVIVNDVEPEKVRNFFGAQARLKIFSASVRRARRRGSPAHARRQRDWRREPD